MKGILSDETMSSEPIAEVLGLNIEVCPKITIEKIVGGEAGKHGQGDECVSCKGEELPLPNQEDRIYR